MNILLCKVFLVFMVKLPKPFVNILQTAHDKNKGVRNSLFIFGNETSQPKFKPPKYMYFKIIIIIIKACWHHLFFWISLTIYPYQPSLLLSLPDGILCPHRADECNFLLVNPNWCIHVEESKGESRLWIPPYFSINAQHVLFMRWEVNGNIIVL